MIIRPGMFLTSTIGTGEGSSRALALLGAEAQGVAMDFRDLSVLVRDTGTPANNFSGNVNSWLTYTSPSTKWIRNSGGTLVSGTTLRTEYDSSGTALGVRIEPAATNLCLRSQEFSNAAWTAQRCLAFGAGSVADVIAAPDGTMTGDFICEDTSVALTHNFFHAATMAIVAGSVVTYSKWFKAGTRTQCRLLISSNGGVNAAYSIFNLATGAVGANASTGTATFIGATIEAWLDGWYRCSVTASVDPAATSCTALFGLVDGSGNISYTGDGTSGLYVWGAQAEVGRWASSYIPTTTATVTRAADLINKSGTGYPSMNAGGTILAAYRLQQTSAAGRILQLYNSGGGVTDHTDMYFLSGSLEGFADGGNVTTTGTKTLTTGIVQKSAHRFTNGSQSISRNGAISHADTRAMTTTFDRLILGYTASALQQMNGHMQYAVILPRQLSDAEINAATTL